MMSAPDARTSSGRMALTVAAVPTGMNAGVRISPRCMAIVPVRAAPSVAWMLKSKRGMAPALSGLLRLRNGASWRSRPQEHSGNAADRRFPEVRFHRRRPALRYHDHVEDAADASRHRDALRQGA